MHKTLMWIKSFFKGRYREDKFIHGYRQVEVCFPFEIGGEG